VHSRLVRRLDRAHRSRPAGELEEKESGGGGKEEEEECGNEERKVMMCARACFSKSQERKKDVIGKYYFNIAALPAVRARAYLTHTNNKEFSFFQNLTFPARDSERQTTTDGVHHRLQFLPSARLFKSERGARFPQKNNHQRRRQRKRQAFPLRVPGKVHQNRVDPSGVPRDGCGVCHGVRDGVADGV